LLWGLPAVLIGLGLVLLVLQLRKRSQAAVVASPSSLISEASGLTPAEQARLRSLLKDE
jgi:cytochrome c-type biogenesis protein CcmH/NrfF